MQLAQHLPSIDTAWLSAPPIDLLPALRADRPNDIQTLLRPLPTAFFQPTHSPVCDYAEALRLLGEQVSHDLERDDVFLVWCFDQSLSMKDDQFAIRHQLHQLYDQVTRDASGYGTSLRTMVSSFGSRFQKHLGRPSDNLDVTRKAIAEVPSDPSGSERLCEALLWATRTFAPMAPDQSQPWLLVVVTDETGDRGGNETLLEQVIAAARKVNCRIFFLGLDPARSDLPELNEQFPPGRPLIAECERAAAKALRLAERMAHAREQLTALADLRSSQPDRRWQANYDLITAQRMAYEVRARACQQCLRQVATAGPAGPAARPARGWKLETVQRLDPADLQAAAAQARQSLEYVVQQHAGTPWSHRAQWELDRGLGVQLAPLP
jgi:hypothetical protein